LPVEPEPWRVGKNAAEALRSRKGWGHGPLNIWKAIRLCESVRVARNAFGAGQGDGLYLWDAKLKNGLIIVNASERPSRQRFTAAHELGHHEIHRLDEKSVEIADKNVLETRNDPAEVAANAFAADLLLPDDAVREELRGIKPAEVTPEHLVELMRSYGVSYQVAANRLNNVGIVNQAHRKRLLDEAEGRIDELMQVAEIDDERLFPPGEDLEAEVANKAFALYRDAVISADRLAQILDRAVDEAVAEAERRGFGRDRGEPDDDAAVLALLS
jgi:Zn-dependent peptidase ImmA (M78 family)